jgi:hypothetical protein
MSPICTFKPKIDIFLAKGIIFNDLFSSGDFDQAYSFIGIISMILRKKTKVHCSVCHDEGHTMERHTESSKRKPRNSKAKDTNRRWGQVLS